MINHLYDPSEGKKVLAVFSHGIGEHLGLYEDLKDALLKADISVLRYDARGHGKSSPLKNNQDYNVFVTDLKSLIDQYKGSHKKVILIGHSFGAIISNLYAVTYKDIDAVISIGYQYHILNKVKIFGFIMPFKKLVFNWQDKRSRHEKKERDYSDPLLLKHIKFKWLYQILFKANRTIHKQMKELKMPYLILHGGSDMIVDLKNAYQFFEKLQTKKEIIIYPQSYHDLLLDIDKDIVTSDIIEFIQSL